MRLEDLISELTARVPSLKKFPSEWWCGGWDRWRPTAVAAAALCAVIEAQAQTTLRSSPYVPFRQPEGAKYNLKWGLLQGRITGEVQSEFNDNINLSEDKQLADWSIGPHLGIGFIYPISKDHLMQFSAGVGYRFYLNSPSINSFSVAPNSSWSHTLSLYDVTLEVHDQFSIQTDPTSQGDIYNTGGPTSLVNFKRISNTAGLFASYQPTLHWTLNAGYDYTIGRSLSDQFTEMDADTHTVFAGSFHAINQRLTTGLSSSYSINEYSRNLQNGGNSFSIGPVLSLKPTAHIYVQFSVGYSSFSFDQSGTLGDNSTFEGITFQGAINHQLNRKVSHSIRVSRNVAPGFRSNFSETFAAQYGVAGPLSRNLTMNATLGYETFVSSMLRDTGDRYIFNMGTSYQLTKIWTAGVSYSLAWKQASVAGRDYLQNRITLGLVRQF